MIKYEDYEYVRPNLEKISDDLHKAIAEFKNAKCENCAYEAILKINSIRVEFDTMASLASNRHKCNMEDKFYQEEDDYFGQARPVYQGIINEYYKALLESKHREALEKKVGHQLFNLAELAQKGYSPEIVPLMQEEHKWVNEYYKLIASAKIEFNGEVYNVPNMYKFDTNLDRSVRKGAMHATSKFYESKCKEFDEVYDNLVKIRTEIAHKLGYENFVEIGYLMRRRSDYTYHDVQKYRQQVLDVIVPLNTKLFEEQRKRLGVDHLYFYDLKLQYPKGNAHPVGGIDTLVSQAQKMYEKLSPETHEFFDFMVDSHLLDLDSRSTKANNGYCTYFGKYKAPFIFSNFNGTTADTDVLTHEAGHAFEAYLNRNREISEYRGSTSEINEIHSMGMEFLTRPYYDMLVDNKDKYFYSKIVDAFKFIPYGCLIDHFQEEVYLHPEMTPVERRACFRRLEKMYIPERDYDGDAFLESGAFFFRQMHPFAIPFYYIDYTFSQLGSLEIVRDEYKDHDAAWNKYMKLCKLGGSLGYFDTLKESGFTNPFTENCVKDIVEPVYQILKNIDTKNF